MCLHTQESTLLERHTRELEAVRAQLLKAHADELDAAVRRQLALLRTRLEGEHRRDRTAAVEQAQREGDEKRQAELHRLAEALEKKHKQDVEAVLLARLNEQVRPRVVHTPPHHRPAGSSLGRGVFLPAAYAAIAR